MGKKKGCEKQPTEKELLEIKYLKLQLIDRRASIISTVVLTIIALVTAIIRWVFGN